MISSTLPLAALIAVVTALAFWLDRHVSFFSKIGASILTLAFGAILSNTGIVPGKSPVYDTISGPVTSLAIAWLLLSVDLRALKQVGPRMLAAFGLACVGTILGAFLGALAFSHELGVNTWKMAGVFTGTYTGGSLNFVAVGKGVGLPDSVWAGTTAADALTGGIWMAANLILPLWLVRFYPPVPKEALELGEGEADNGGKSHPFFDPAAVSALDLGVLLAVGLSLLVAADLTARLVPQVPSVLWLTTYALIVGHTPLFRKAEGALQLGTLLLHLFFVVIGIWSQVGQIIAVGVVVFYYTATVIGSHGLVLYGVGRLLGLDLGTLSVASQAAVGGPSTALAVAVGRDWPGLVLPGIIVGLVGYAVGNYLGFGVAYLVHGFGIGL
ncbi:MAG: DUF819 family protein [Gemmatimonadetes bacterium]|nr:DUF819 family protein [Gemmatimonadota bacterium]